MNLRFHDDAIILSGATGTKLKTDTLAEYYRFWIGVTSGGQSRSYANPTVIVDMNAATGEIYLEDSNEIVLGSAGHALELRYGTGTTYPNTSLALVESDSDCFQKLLKVISRRWPQIGLSCTSEGYYISADAMTFVFPSLNLFLSQKHQKAFAGNGLFFFDPLLYADWALIESIARERIESPFDTGTEFLVFFFTSDWVNGRKEFSPLPKTADISKWSGPELESAKHADEAYGRRSWLKVTSSNATTDEIENGLVELYRDRLRRWFRFVQPLPFKPKADQRYDVFCCSNYALGMRVVTDIYQKKTGNSMGITADNKSTYHLFDKRHAGILKTPRGRKKPPEWTVLWHVMKNHVGGVCDEWCPSLFEKTGNDLGELKRVLQWLANEGYLSEVAIHDWLWSAPRFPVYQVDWNFTKKAIGVDRPIPPKPLVP